MQRTNPKEESLYDLYKNDSSQLIHRSLALAAPVAQTAVTLVGYYRMSQKADNNEMGCYVSLMFLLSQLSFAVTGANAMEAIFGLHFTGRGFSKQQYGVLAAICVVSIATIINLDRSIPSFDKDLEGALKAGLIAAFGAGLNNAASFTATLFFAKNKNIPIKQAHIQMSEKDCRIM